MNEFKPNWDAMAVMVEEQQRMAKKIEELEARIAEYRNPQQRTDLMEKNTWQVWTDIMQKNGALTIHVLPANDLREHEKDATCWCEPRVDEELNIVTHISADNREAFETGERKPT